MIFLRTNVRKWKNPPSLPLLVPVLCVQGHYGPKSYYRNIWRGCIDPLLPAPSPCSAMNVGNPLQVYPCHTTDKSISVKRTKGKSDESLNVVHVDTQEQVCSPSNVIYPTPAPMLLKKPTSAQLAGRSLLQMGALESTWSSMTSLQLPSNSDAVTTVARRGSGSPGIFSSMCTSSMPQSATSFVNVVQRSRGLLVYAFIRRECIE